MAFYHDQHMAWQQRVSKELNAASRFIRYYLFSNFQSQPRPTSKSSRNSHYSSHSAKPNLTGHDLRHLNVFAEVRGKYARPPPANHQKPDNSALTPKNNPLIIRPTTSGSLKPRSASLSRPKSVNHQDKPIENSPVMQYNKKYRSLPEKKDQADVDRIVFDHHNKKESENIDVNNHENITADNKDEELELQDEVNDLENHVNGSEPEEEREKGSQITTSSQKRYILELESLLRDEKIRRIELEKTLQKVKFNKAKA